MYVTTKTYTHAEGLSCCFRQWRATHSHCSHLHGYALQVQIVFEADKLDDRNWVVDFGGMRKVKAWLKDTFDHTLVIAEDDPERERFMELDKAGLCTLRLMQRVGCEAFAEEIAAFVLRWIGDDNNLYGRVRLRSVQVAEHGGNSCTYEVT